jgi:hypothetical protein
MGEKLRTPLFVVAAILIVLVVAFEVGAQFILGKASAGAGALQALVKPQLEKEDLSADDRQDILNKLKDPKPTPPGFAIPYTALLDGLVLFAVALIALPLIIPDRLHGNIQGIISLIVSLVVLIVAIFMILAAFMLLMLMIGLFTAAPFGTIAYFALWGFFNRGGATAVLGLLMLLKLGFAVCLILAHPGFLKNKGLVLIVFTSLLANVIIGFLHGFVPIFLVSITDMIAAIISAILAAIWAIFLLIGAIISIVKVIL